MALGAQRSDITTMVTGTGARLAGLGIAFGAIAAVISTQLLSGLLFGVSATDPITFILAALIVGAVTLLASYVPSRSAATTDPITALRYD
jgi:ABC-type antimicrobial peptide transport system permease subunit